MQYQAMSSHLLGQSRMVRHVARKNSSKMILIVCVAAYLHSLLARRPVRGFGRPSYPRRGREVLRLLLDASAAAAAAPFRATPTSSSSSAGLGVVNDSSPTCLPCPQRSPLGYVLLRQPRRKRYVRGYRQERDLGVPICRGRVFSACACASNGLGA